MIEIQFKKAYTGGWDNKFKSSFDKMYEFIRREDLDLQGVIDKLEINSKMLDATDLLPETYGFWVGIKNYNFPEVIGDELATHLFIENGLVLKEKLGEGSHNNIFFDQLYTMMYGNETFSEININKDFEDHRLSISAYDNYNSIITSLYR